MNSFKVKRNLAIAGEPMSQEEFVDLIKEAEKGPFYSLEEIKAKVDLWKTSLKNKN